MSGEMAMFSALFLGLGIIAGTLFSWAITACERPRLAFVSGPCAGAFFILFFFTLIIGRVFPS